MGCTISGDRQMLTVKESRVEVLQQIVTANFRGRTIEVSVDDTHNRKATVFVDRIFSIIGDKDDA
jgi:hypothetical protein